MAVKRKAVGRTAKDVQFRADTLAPLFQALEDQYRTRAGLARKYGAARQSISDWESGTVQPPHGFIAWMANELGLGEDIVPANVRNFVERKAKGGMNHAKEN